MEQTALDQLEAVASLADVKRAVGLPDLHAGKTPIGAVAASRGIIYPHLIGNDIGCGMGLFQTNCTLKKYKPERFTTRLNHIRALEDIAGEIPSPEGCPIHGFRTIGGGNHFAEFQTVDQIYDQDVFDTLGIDRKRLLLLIHSGSRGYGNQILNRFPDTQGLPADSPEAERYLSLHTDALYWARENRHAVAQMLMEYLGYASEAVPVLDCFHNYLEQYEGYYLHRKGAVSAKNGAVLIPGSRGSLTYLVAPAQDTEKSLWSLSHGAGRKWSRSMCKGRIKGKYSQESIRTTRIGSRVVCHDTELLYQEAPEAYKNIKQVIGALVENNLCHVIATLKPLLTYKG